MGPRLPAAPSGAVPSRTRRSWFAACRPTARRLRTRRPSARARRCAGASRSRSRPGRRSSGSYATRAVNVVARDRGDRFWILVFDATKAQARRSVEAIQKNFDGAVDARLDQEGIRLGVTVGIAAYPEDAFDTPSLVLRAEEALDVAMAGPKGSIALYGALSAADAGP